jgi:acetyl esterase/lipase
VSAGSLPASGPGVRELMLSAPGVTADAQTLTDLPYADRSPAQTLDLYLPKRSGQAVALVVFVHGGAFSGGDKREVLAVPTLLDQGYGVASVNYRLSGEAPFPAGVQDVKAAVRWLRAHAGEYGIDPVRFAVWGASAGGYLANMVGVSGGQFSGLDDVSLGNPTVSSQVQVVVSWYGPSDFAAMDAQERQIRECAGRAQTHDDAGSPESVWLGAPVQTAPLTHAANPIAWLPSAPAGSLPAFLLGHGSADCTVPPGQSTELAQALTRAGGAATLKIINGAGHADEQVQQQLLAPSLEFISVTLRRIPQVSSG